MINNPYHSAAVRIIDIAFNNNNNNQRTHRGYYGSMRGVTKQSHHPLLRLLPRPLPPRPVILQLQLQQLMLLPPGGPIRIMQVDECRPPELTLIL
jgi:hypothetical protein